MPLGGGEPDFRDVPYEPASVNKVIKNLTFESYMLGWRSGKNNDFTGAEYEQAIEEADKWSSGYVR